MSTANGLTEVSKPSGARVFYTGIGSRKTPPEMLDLMRRLARRLAKSGWVLRSGGADGADAAFACGVAEGGTPDMAEIYLPWANFNRVGSGILVTGSAWSEAERLASEVHPVWNKLGAGPRRLHTRNAFQVLGGQLRSPSRCVLCWTEDGCESEKTSTSATGGSRTAIVLAERNGVPVINLRNESAMARLTRVFEGEQSKPALRPVG